MVERLNSTLKKTLKKAGSKANQWNKWLPFVLYAIRIVPHIYTGHSPFELLFGRLPETPISSLRRAIEEPETELPRKYLKQLQSRMQLAQQAAGETDQQAKENSKSYQDKRRKAVDSPLSPGDYVLCLEPKKKRGLSARWADPYPATLPTYWMLGREGRERGITTHSSCVSQKVL